MNLSAIEKMAIEYASSFRTEKGLELEQLPYCDISKEDKAYLNNELEYSRIRKQTYIDALLNNT